MTTDINILIGQYADWLRDNTAVRAAGDWFEITTPFLDRHNDYIQIYARSDGTGYILTDDGYTIQDLAQSGCELKTPKRDGLLAQTLHGFGVERRADNLQVRTSRAAFAQRKHDLIQSILAVNDMFSMAEPVSHTLFLEDVAHWLDSHDVRYTPQVKVTGKSRYDHLFDFVVPKSRTHPERFGRAVNHPDKSAAESLAFSWEDTRAARPEGSRAFAILNDEQRDISPSVTEALAAYEVRPVLWSLRESALPELAA